MDCLANIGGAILGPVFRYMFAPVGEYLFSYKDKKKNLENQVKKLDDKINMIQSVTGQARNEGYAIMRHVQDWQGDATTKSEEAKRFLQPDPDHTRARCSCRRPLPNLALRWRLSKEAKDMAEVIESLIRKANDFGNNISFRPAVQHSLEQEDFEKFETRDKTLREIMEALRNPEVRMIGLCGLGGMGKTMLVKEVARLANEGNLFNKQISAVVSQNPDIKQIQRNIAEQLGLKFEEEDVTNRAQVLGKRLKEEQKILIILDDVWKALDLSKVGIPFTDDSKGCKIILTSRDRDACKQMGADTFEIKSLTNEEATNLFNKTVGNIKPEFRSIATEVIGECGGLPLAIVTIASALKIHKSLPFWRDASLKLKRSPEEFKIYGAIYGCFKTSFDALEEEEKSLLLICSAHDEDENVSLEELTGYVMVLDLFRHVDTLKEASDRVQYLVENLKDCSLLSDGNYRRTVKVHDVIRDVAILIASKLEKNPMYCLRQSVRLSEGCLKRENFKELYAISVPGGGGGFNDDRLPERLACPRLKLLMLRTIGGLEITDRFFEETEELEALRLDVKGGKKLASSFRSLQNLKALHLRIWKGEDVDIAIIGELTNLLILDLSDSEDLVALPKEIGNLSRLQLLNLTGCYRLKVTEPNVILRLVKLEELYMMFVWRETECPINASLVSEIKDLRKLRVLRIRIPDVSFVPEDMFNHLNLERYHIQIGPYTGFSFILLSTRALLVNNLKDRSLLYEDGFQRLMKKSVELRLESIPGVGHIVNELDASSFQDLECLELIDLENLESFMPTSLPTRSIERPTLFNDKVVAGMSFRNLQELMISKCNNVQYMFSFAMVESLIQLKKLEVSKCEAMEQIVTKAVGEYGRLKNIISFPKLESLELQDLPKLKRFCEGDCIEFPSLSRLMICACYELRTFVPNSHESTVTLLPAIEERELEAQQTLFNEKVVATKLTDLVVWKCHGLISLFNSSTATSLAQLTRVIIGECNQMKQVIHVNDQMEDESAAENEIVFSQLKTVALYCLPNLKCFHSGNIKLQFPNLEKFILSEYPEMRSFSHGTTNTPNLNKLIIAGPRLRFYDLDWVFETLEEAEPIEELWEGDLNRTIRKLWDDSYIALQWIFSETVDDQNSGEDTAGHDQKIQNNKENAASSSKEART